MAAALFLKDTKTKKSTQNGREFWVSARGGRSILSKGMKKKKDEVQKFVPKPKGPKAADS